MKKIIAVLATVLLLSGSLTAFAAQSRVSTVPENRNIEVTSNRKNNKDYYEIIIGAAGLDSVKLPDGTVISGKSDSAADNGLSVIIIPVTAEAEAAAYAWMSDAAKTLGKDPTAYYLAFYKNGSGVQPAGKITITSTVRPDTDLFYMDSNAEAAKITDKTAAETVSFEMKSTGYYISAKSQKPPTPTPDSPKTGDNSHIELLLLFMAISAAVLLALYGIRKRQSRQ